ncbi:SusC/RagA family TonB-linked outer membrane protein [Pseudochryseolinea flava]|uniref:SusC/RagA family TonB-linked outer membrane protein n=1 Tax=Pseudochryseolinea flava TaxID=2059302 RepID=A0A364Y3P1_9BACT|nr:SusC/RagA family TonB-linked outer membrane protein [Pseudochryseolinea flava]RAW01570.1 SusC/RagA family TonB-linked outer membrane protein [Pseudochryseolinea flava]
MKISFTRKLWKVMKYCAYQMMLSLLFFSTIYASRTEAQILERPITINLENVPFTQALQEIGLAAHIKFAYSDELSRSESNVTLMATNKPLRLVLNEMLGSRNIQYKLHEPEQIITLKRATKVSSLGNQGDAQRSLVQVRGVVTDATTNLPMAGVNVIVKFTTKGTTSDVNGKYAIDVERGEVLVFSFIGFAPVELRVNDEIEMNVSMLDDASSLKEVVVNAGYWKVDEKENTGSIGKVSNEIIEAQPVSSVLQAMQGRITGVYIAQQNGIPGSNFNVQIRGRNSIAASNDPLYIVDGIPYPSTTMSSTFTTGSLFGSAGSSPLSTLSPENIESIEVLKDADATAIYGSRGANGVILITTKRASEGKSSVMVNINSGVSHVSKKMKLLNTRDYLTMRREAFRNDGVEAQPNTAPDLLLWDTTRYTDWQEELLGDNAGFTNVSAVLSGGNAETQYVFNNSYQRQGSVFAGDSRYHRGSSHLAVTNRALKDRLTSSFDITYNAEKNNIQPIDLTSIALLLAPNAPALYDQDGKLNWQSSTWTNPLSYLEQRYESSTRNLITSVNLEYKLLEGLEVKSRFSYNDLRLTEKSLTPSTFFDPVYNATAEYASATFNTSLHRSWIWEPQLNFQKTFDKFRVNALLGSTSQNTDREQQIFFATNFASDALIDDINAAGSVDVIGNNISQYRYMAVFGRLNASYDGRYIMNLTARRDGSSRFGSANRFATFMALGGAWIFSNESFVQENLSFLSFGKLRSSFGTTGNDQIGDYGFLDTYQPSNGYNGVSGLVPKQLFNPNYGWEINRKFEAALELGFWNDRLSIKTNFYRNRSSSQLVGYPLPLTTGFSSIQSNLDATVQNTGWEFEISADHIAKQNLSWNTSLTLTIPRNKLIAFPGLETSTYASRYVVGEPLTISKRYKLLGVDPLTGVYKFDDFTGDSNITSADRQYVQNVGLQYYGGLTNTIRYKNFQLDVFVQFVKQTGYNYQALIFSFPGSSQQPARVLDDRWQQQGNIASVQRFSHSNFSVYQAQSQYRDSDAVIEDASFIRLKNVNFSYTLTRSLLKKLECRFYIQGQNLFTLTNYYGLDPEAMNISLPALRTFTTGIQITL